MMRDALSAVWSNPYVKVFVALLGIAAFVLLFRAVHPAGALFLGAFGLAYVVHPVVDGLERWRVHRGLGVLLVVVALVAGVWTAVQLSISAIHATLTETEDGIAFTDAAADWFLNFPENLDRLLPSPVMDLIAGPVANVGEMLGRIGEMIAPHVEGITNVMVGLLSGTVMGAFQVFVTLILTVYVLYDFHRIAAAFFGAVPMPYRETARSLIDVLDDALGNFIRGQLIIAALVGVMVYVGLTLIGLPLAGFIGLLAGVLNIVPFLGSIVPAIPALVIALAGGWWQVLLVLVVFVVANQIDNHLLTPYVMSRSTRLHPVTIIVAVIGGFALGGIVAAILAVPVVASLTVLYKRHYKVSRFYREG